MIADIHARSIERLREYAVIKSVYSREIEKARAFARRHGVGEFYDDWRRVVRDEEVDAVVIATPNYTHREIAVEAARRGKHVFLEKPIATRLEDAREIVGEAERSGVKLFIGHCLRYWPEYVRVREAVSRGEIGSPSVARVYRLSSFPRWGGGWHGYMEYSGGVVVDLAIHDIDFLVWTLGPVSRVYGVGGRFTRDSVDAIDHAMYIIEFENGAIAYGEASWAMPETMPFTTYLEIAGSGGALAVDNRSTASVYEYTDRGSRSYSPVYRDAYYYEMRAFLRWVLYNEPVSISPEEAVESLRVALAINKSIIDREIVDLRRFGT